jgi:hypothetical protein
MPSNSQLVFTGLAVVATGVVGYAAWFDYKRRNDPVFRKNLSECHANSCAVDLRLDEAYAF